MFYLLEFRREDVCQEGSNKFFWKYAREYLDESFIDKLVAFTPVGLKSHPRPYYTTLNFIEKNLEGINPDDVEAQCGMVIAKLFKWL